jgi:hypothetical protein
MAILNKISCIPSEAECVLLSNISGLLEVWQPKLVPGARPQKVLLKQSDSNQIITVYSDYSDVRFKFECLYLKISNTLEKQIPSDGTKVGNVQMVDKIKMIIRTEWERAALPNEVPSHYDQIVQVRGPIDDVPKESPACVAIVGILFEAKDSSPTGMLYLDEDFPLAISFTDDSDKIREYLVDTISISPADSNIIRNQTKNWRIPQPTAQ